MKQKEFLTRLVVVAVTAAAFLLLILAVKAARAAKEGDFVALFNGRDLTGWQTKGNWFARDGVLEIEPREGETGWKRYDAYLWAEKSYGDFVLDLEFKHPTGGNSGVFLRVGDPANPVETGIEVQILDCYGKAEALTHHDLGGVIKTVGPSKNMSKPPGEWNRMIITCKGGHLQVRLNGEDIVDVDLAATPAAGKPRSGRLGLQDHGVPLSFRNIRIREFPAEEAK